MSYLGWYLLFFILPGWLLSRLLPIGRIKPFFLWPAFSYVSLTLTWTILRISGGRPAWFTRLFFVELLGLCLLVLWKKTGNQKCQQRPVLRQAPQQLQQMGIRYGFLIVLLVLAGLYLYFAGPYLELPADAWEHLRRMQVQAHVLQANAFAEPFTLRDLLRQGHCWYFLCALLAKLSGMDVFRAAPHIMFLNSLLWLAALYGFALKIFAGLGCCGWRKQAAAALSVCFYAVQFGVNVFAFWRYYAAAPAMLNFALYLAAVSFLLDILRRCRWRLIWLPAIFMFSANLVHTQEALFIFFMAWGMGLVCLMTRRPILKKFWTPAWLFAGGGTVALIAGFFFFRHQPLAAGWECATLQLRLPFLDGVLIEAPLLCFYPVIGLWGIFIYLLCVLWRGCWRHQLFLVAGLIMPLLTVFNPWVVGLMLRTTQDAWALYRLNYLLPLPFLAGLVGVQIWRQKFIAALAVWLGLIGLLVPWPAPWFAFAYHRWPTLRPVPAARDGRHWADLIEFLKDLPPHFIITDQVTAYLLRGATHHSLDGETFKFNPYAWWLQPDTLETDLSRLWGCLPQDKPVLLVVNLRDGADSPVGRISRHWPEDVLKVSRYYVPRTLAWISAHTNECHRIWEAPRVDVYRLHPPH